MRYQLSAVLTEKKLTSIFSIAYFEMLIFTIGSIETPKRNNFSKMLSMGSHFDSVLFFLEWIFNVKNDYQKHL